MEERTVRVNVHVFLKEGIEDVMGKGKLRSLVSNGFSEVQSVREGQLIELSIKLPEGKDVESRVKDMCKKLLCNPTTSSYTFEVIE